MRQEYLQTEDAIILLQALESNRIHNIHSNCTSTKIDESSASVFV